MTKQSSIFIFSDSDTEATTSDGMAKLKALLDSGYVVEATESSSKRIMIIATRFTEAGKIPGVN